MGSITSKTHPNGLEYLEINTELCQARIFLQGAQIDHFKPAGQLPLLWVSPADDYQIGNGIRGGVPICWPWFGASDKTGFPQHGFARTRIWQLESSEIIDEIAYLRFSLPLTDADKQFWPYDTQVMVEFELSNKLIIKLTNHNTSSEPVTLTQALHSYFPIQDIHQLKATGFSNAEYIEFGKGPYSQDTDEVEFNRETDRVYTNLTDTQQLHTPEGIIQISRHNSQSAVLWNPWIEKSKRLSRFKEEDYLSMVCLESANVLQDAVCLAPDQSHTLSTEIRWL